MRAWIAGLGLLLVGCGAGRGEGSGGGAGGGGVTPGPVVLAGDVDAFAAAGPVVVWAQGGRVLARARAGSDTWSDPVRLDGGGIRSGERPRVALDATGAGFAAWIADDGGIHVARREANGAWSKAEELLEPLPELRIDGLAVDAQGDAAIGFHLYDPERGVWDLGAILHDGVRGTWRRPGVHATQRQAITDLALRRDGDLLTVFAILVDSLQQRLLAIWIDWDTRRDRLVQTAGETLNRADDGLSRDPLVALDSAGAAHVLWRQLAADGSERVQMLSSDPGRIFPATSRILSTGAGASIAIAAGATAAIVHGSRLLVARPGEATEEPLATSAAITSCALTDDPAVAWTDADGNLALAVRGADAWDLPEIVDAGSAEEVRLARDGAELLVIWRRAGGELVARRR